MQLSIVFIEQKGRLKSVVNGYMILISSPLQQLFYRRNKSILRMIFINPDRNFAVVTRLFGLVGYDGKILTLILCISVRNRRGLLAGFGAMICPFIIYFHDYILGIISEFLTEEIEAAHISGIRFNSYFKRNIVQSI